MVIIIKKDGQVVTDAGNPFEGKALEDAAMLLADAQDGDSIVYDGTNHMWKAGQGGGSFAPDITDPQDGDTLVYNAAQSKWVNGAGGGDGGGYLKITMDETTHALDKTWKEISDAFLAGNYCSVFHTDVDGMMSERVNIVGSFPSENAYFIGTDSSNFTADSENGYPVLAH